MLRSLALSIAVAGVLVTPTVAGAAPLPAGTTALLSGAADLRTPLGRPVSDAELGAEAVSQNGRRIAFSSRSDGLLAGDDDDVSNVYVRDADGVVTLVSRRSGPAGDVAHANCSEAAISDDGRRVGFTCDGPLDPADTNSVRDVYVRDLGSEQTILVSRASGGGAVGSDSSRAPSLDQDGDVVVFSSAARNLGVAIPGNVGVAAYRRQIGGGDAVSVVSRTAGSAGVVTDGITPSVSDDGSRVAFATFANVDAVDGNGRLDVYVRDLGASSTTLVSRAVPGGAVGNDASFEPRISGDGTSAIFTSRATNLAPEDTNRDPDAYLRRTDGSSGRVVHAAGSGTAEGISDAGDIVAFTSSFALDPADRDPGPDVYVTAPAGPRLASRRDGAAGSPSDHALGASISGDGSTVALDIGRALTDDVDPAVRGVAIRSLATSTTVAASRPHATAPFRNDGGDARAATTTPDGRLTAFVTSATGLGAPSAAQPAIIVRDAVTGSVVVASRADGPDGAPLRGRLADPSISADGRRVAFGFVDTDAPPAAQRSQILVRDLASGRTIVASRADGLAGSPGDGSSTRPSISEDGSRVAFVSEARNLGDGDTDDMLDIHLREIDSGRTVLVSRANGAAGAKGNNSSREAAISGDGRHVAFGTRASNLGDGDGESFEDIHVRSLETGETRLASVADAATNGTATAVLPSIDRSGGRVTFVGSGLDSGDTGLRVYVRDLNAGSLVVASRPDDPAGDAIASGMSQPRISLDGRAVAFVGESRAGAAPGAPDDGSLQVLLRDLAAGRTSLISRRTGANGAPDTSTIADPPVVGGVTEGGGCVVFSTVGPLVDGLASSDASQVYLRAVAPGCGTMPVPGGPDGGGSGGGQVDRTAPRLSRMSLLRRSFRVGGPSKRTRKRPALGTELRVTSSEAAKLTVVVERERPGAKKGKRCRVAKRRPRRGGCTAYSRDGVVRKDLRVGSNRVGFSGRIGRKRLAVGRHRMTITARDAAGNVSKAYRLRFTIRR
ncbi:hypothetical protein PAI11_29790 [Patulibacter medicamentivorans]|uniref:Uncharacterized protein n=1 Tax=Patulibacter medicamentivorans TaxID=1097667 RepID=H0E822_9ACTN|nr:hypothetical protein PAI11_29790 [Patulibacter medicamentivorans]